MTNLTDFSLYIASRTIITLQKPSQGIKLALLDLNTKLSEEKECLTRLDEEITNLESNPSEAEKKQALEEIGLGLLEYKSIVSELKSMHTSTSNHLFKL